MAKIFFSEIYGAAHIFEHVQICWQRKKKFWILRKVLTEIPARFVHVFEVTPTLAFLSMKEMNINSVNRYILKVNNENTRKRCETCSKLTIKTPEPRQ